MLNIALTAPGLVRAVRAGLGDSVELDDEYAFQFRWWISGVVHSYDNAYYQYRIGTLDEDRWAMHRADIVRFFARSGVIQWWQDNPDYGGGGRDEFSPEFVALVEEILGEEPDRAEG